MNNIQFDYQYRDAYGSKACDYIVFPNPENISAEEITSRLEQAFWDSEFFIAGQIRIPELFLYLSDAYDPEIDHCFHHFDSVTIVPDPLTDVHNRTIGEFITEVESQASLGWKLFDPWSVAPFHIGHNGGAGTKTIDLPKPSKLACRRSIRDYSILQLQ